MKTLSNPMCRALVVLLACAWLPALAAERLSIFGKWAPDEGAGAKAGSPALTIEGSKLSWSGSKDGQPACVREFTLREERPGTVYTNGRGTKFVAGAKGSLPTFLLRIGASTCARTADAVRISFPLVYDSRHIEVLELAQGRVIASQRFYRLK
jgi:hypothetical protein